MKKHSFYCYPYPCQGAWDTPALVLLLDIAKPYLISTYNKLVSTLLSSRRASINKFIHSLVWESCREFPDYSRLLSLPLRLSWDRNQDKRDLITTAGWAGTLSFFPQPPLTAMASPRCSSISCLLRRKFVSPRWSNFSNAPVHPYTLSLRRELSQSRRVPLGSSFAPGLNFLSWKSKIPTVSFRRFEMSWTESIVLRFDTRERLWYNDTLIRFRNKARVRVFGTKASARVSDAPGQRNGRPQNKFFACFGGLEIWVKFYVKLKVMMRHWWQKNSTLSKRLVSEDQSGRRWRTGCETSNLWLIV